jgi:hypothetical protein
MVLCHIIHKQWAWTFSTTTEQKETPALLSSSPRRGSAAASPPEEPTSLLLPPSPPAGATWQALVAPAACLSSRRGEQGRALPLPSGGAPREVTVRRGRVVMVLWRRRGRASWARWWSPAASLQDLGNLGSRWAQAGLDAFVCGASWRWR